MQLSLQLSQCPEPPDATWEALTVDDRRAVVGALAKVMAKTVDDKEGQSE